MATLLNPIVLTRSLQFKKTMELDKTLATDLENLVKEKYTDKSRLGYTTVANFMLPLEYLKFQNTIGTHEVFDTDIWICSFPKSGNRWISEMVWLMINEFNCEKAKNSILDERTGMLDSCFLHATTTHSSATKFPEYVTDSISFTKKLPEPRIIRTHLPFHLLPKQIQNGEKHPKIIYINRNPMDTCISNYYYEKSTNFTGSLDELCKMFLHGKVVYGPFFEHVLPFWNMRNKPNVLFLKYEEMREDLEKVIRKVGNFLEKSVSDVEINVLKEHLSPKNTKGTFSASVAKVIQTLKTAQASHSSIREGTVGEYRKEMSPNYISMFQKWMESNLQGTELTY